VGSGNIGATNARRAGGWGLGLATLSGDVLKGAAPVFLALVLTRGADVFIKDICMSLVAISAFFGHLFPVYLKFKTGGKGVATAAGCFAVLSLPALGVALIVFFFVAVFSNRVSVGSIAAAVILPICIYGFKGSIILTGCAVIISAMIIYRHRENIKRLIAGTESTIWNR